MSFHGKMDNIIIIDQTGPVSSAFVNTCPSHFFISFQLTLTHLHQSNFKLQHPTSTFSFCSSREKKLLGIFSCWSFGTWTWTGTDVDVPDVMMLLLLLFLLHFI